MSGIRVLIADDHAVLRSGLKLLIDAQSDMRVVGETGDGPETVRVARATAPLPFDGSKPPSSRFPHSPRTTSSKSGKSK